VLQVVAVTYGHDGQAAAERVRGLGAVVSYPSAARPNAGSSGAGATAAWWQSTRCARSSC
jgi:hypothetical protein